MVSVKLNVLAFDLLLDTDSELIKGNLRLVKSTPLFIRWAPSAIFAAKPGSNQLTPVLMPCIFLLSSYKGSAKIRGHNVIPKYEISRTTYQILCCGYLFVVVRQFINIPINRGPFQEKKRNRSEFYPTGISAIHVCHLLINASESWVFPKY